LLLKCDIHHNLFFDDGKNYVQKASSRAKAVDESVYEGYVERKLRLGGGGNTLRAADMGVIPTLIWLAITNLK
jgi:hypothetical protein